MVNYYFFYKVLLEIDMLPLIVHLFWCKFLLQAIHIYGTCFPYNKDILRQKQVFHQIYWNIMTVFESKKIGCQYLSDIRVPQLQYCTGNRRWFSIIIVGKPQRVYSIFLVLWFRWKRRFQSKEPRPLIKEHLKSYLKSENHHIV